MEWNEEWSTPTYKGIRTTMINEDTPDKLKEIIRDTWPQLYHLKRNDNENQQGFQGASASVIASVLNKESVIENQ